MSAPDQLESPNDQAGRAMPIIEEILTILLGAAAAILLARQVEVLALQFLVGAVAIGAVGAAAEHYRRLRQRRRRRARR